MLQRKTLLHRHEPIDIDQANVSPTIEFSKQVANQDQFLELQPKHKRIVIVGTAGSGKSMLLKHLFVSLCRAPIGKLPIFIEMRHLPNAPEKTPTGYIHSQMPGWSLTSHQTNSNIV